MIIDKLRDAIADISDDIFDDWLVENRECVSEMWRAVHDYDDVPDPTDADLRELGREEFDSAMSEFDRTLAREAEEVDGQLLVYRALHVPHTGQFVNSLSDGMPVSGHRGLGIYWTWMVSKASPYWGRGGETVIVKAAVDFGAIDVFSTGYSNCAIAVGMLGNAEREITLKEGAQVSVLAVMDGSRRVLKSFRRPRQMMAVMAHRQQPAPVAVMQRQLERLNDELLGGDGTVYHHNDLLAVQLYAAAEEEWRAFTDAVRALAPRYGWRLLSEHVTGRHTTVLVEPNYGTVVTPPRFLFHVTPAANLPSVLKSGLTPQRSRWGHENDPRIYLLTDQADVDGLKRQMRTGGDESLVVLRVDTGKLRGRVRFYADGEFARPGRVLSVWTRTHIPADAVEVLDVE